MSLDEAFGQQIQRRPEEPATGQCSQNMQTKKPKRKVEKVVFQKLDLEASQVPLSIKV